MSTNTVLNQTWAAHIENWRSSGLSAKANGLEPSSYIQYVLDHIADADTLEKFEALLPWNMPKAS